MKLKKQVTVCGAAIFCVAVFSLYLMLDRVQHDPTRHQSGGNFPRAERRPSFLSVSPQDCQFALGGKGQSPDLQMLAVYSLLPFDNQDGGVWKQGFDITYEPNEWDAEPLQVFVVPHSHNDPGWIKTFDKYYYDQTQHILNSMVLKMQEDPRRRFIWSEISFFSKWWDNISAQKRAAVRRLVGNGQLEMVTGGWVMPDEANSHYFAMIDQLIEGHQWLEKNIGVTPRSGWAVDPFGYSSTMPYLLKRSNLTGMLIQRVHYSIKKHFAATQNLEFMWRQTWDPDASTDIFCHMMPFYSYDVPHTCGPDPKICCQFDFKRLPGGRINCPWKVPPRAITDANVAERAQLLLDQYRKKSKLYRSKVLLVPLGDDFRYDKPQEWDAQFLNYQRIFDFLNSQPNLHVQAQFGTLSDYFDALYKKMGIVPGMKPPGFPVLTGDFFSYADREDHYWTGYYTSRPFYKSLDRVLEAHLRGAEILYSLALAHARRAGADGRYPLSDYSLLSNARRNLGLFQHHDAIAGTAKEAVAVDYGVRLLHSLTNLKRVIINAAHYLVLGDRDAYRHDPAAPFLSTDDTRPNQDSLPERTVVKLDTSPRFLVVFNPLEQEVLVDSPHVRVLSEEGQPLPSQLSAHWGSATDMVPDVYQVRGALVPLPASILSLHSPCPLNPPATVKSSVRLYLHGRDLPVRKQEAVPVHVFPATADDFCLENQHLQACFSGHSGLLQRIRQAGEERGQRVSSEFLVYGTRRSPLCSANWGRWGRAMGQPWLPHCLPAGVEGLSLDVSCLVDIRDHINKELALRFSTDIESDDTFFTDLNGFQVSSSLGRGSSHPWGTVPGRWDPLSAGQLEVILDRRLMQDDNRGLGQGLKDNKRTCNRFRLLLEHRATANKALVMPVAQEKPAPPALRSFVPLSTTLPCDFHILNLRMLQAEDDSLPSAEAALILHRKGFDCSLEAKNLGFNCTTSQGKLALGSLFQGLELGSLQPTSLTLMYPLGTASNSTNIHLDPMEIATFRIRLG
ncbi:PREDICTED: alpha-mannosidase 2x [Charadrius vociferus]|uniref:alpha-mannosidase 2x n=1 Tax=Charadrius vociferus TaxID=50402 RepID=UPI000521321A|nr:PREDICTED: alpha-mannosidase 2x [Charadrius vociferus]